jgi:hypothetical protein
MKKIFVYIICILSIETKCDSMPSVNYSPEFLKEYLEDLYYSDIDASITPDIVKTIKLLKWIISEVKLDLKVAILNAHKPPMSDEQLDRFIKQSQDKTLSVSGPYGFFTQILQEFKQFKIPNVNQLIKTAEYKRLYRDIREASGIYKPIFSKQIIKKHESFEDFLKTSHLLFHFYALSSIKVSMINELLSKLMQFINSRSEVIKKYSDKLLCAPDLFLYYAVSAQDQLRIIHAKVGNFVRLYNVDEMKQSAQQIVGNIQHNMQEIQFAVMNTAPSHSDDSYIASDEDSDEDLENNKLPDFLHRMQVEKLINYRSNSDSFVEEEKSYPEDDHNSVSNEEIILGILVQHNNDKTLKKIMTASVTGLRWGLVRICLEKLGANVDGQSAGARNKIMYHGSTLVIHAHNGGDHVDRGVIKRIRDFIINAYRNSNA